MLLQGCFVLDSRHPATPQADPVGEVVMKHGLRLNHGPGARSRYTSKGPRLALFDLKKREVNLLETCLKKCEQQWFSKFQLR
ncbi:hypothetical protein GDO86_002795, partial [Hymenochirus boettgeri]